MEGDNLFAQIHKCCALKWQRIFSRKSASAEKAASDNAANAGFLLASYFPPSTDNPEDILFLIGPSSALTVLVALSMNERLIIIL